MRKKRLFSAAAISVSMALSLSACVVKDGEIETDPTSQTTTTAVRDTEDVKETSVTESSEEVTTTVDVSSEPVSEEETPTALEESTENDTEEATDEVTTEEESTEEDTTPEETTIEEEPTPEETTTPEPTTPEPTTPEPTTAQPTTPEPLIVETTTVKEPETKVELVSIKAEVKGTHYIGDTLTGNDFVVTGTYSDGHTESLNGWGADPLKLTSAETKITVSKGTVKTVITVKAQEKPAATVASVSATVSGTHYIGDTLTGADFTVTVKMSDGTTLTNPAGWAAAPLTLSAASTNITVSYGGVSGVVTVNASERPTQPQPQNPGQNVTYNGKDIVIAALNCLGDPYVYAGTTKAGFDCSGFVAYCYKQVGVTIPTGTVGQKTCGKKYDMWDAIPGDIVVTEADGWIHTAIYCGGGYVLEARDGQGVACNVIAGFDWIDDSKTGRKIYAIRPGINTAPKESYQGSDEKNYSYSFINWTYEAFNTDFATWAFNAQSINGHTYSWDGFFKYSEIPVHYSFNNGAEEREAIRAYQDYYKNAKMFLDIW